MAPAVQDGLQGVVAAATAPRPPNASSRAAASTPMFAVGRVAGWTAHAMEQASNGKLIRPDSRYVGPRGLRYTALEER